MKGVLILLLLVFCSVCYCGDTWNTCESIPVINETCIIIVTFNSTTGSVLSLNLTIEGLSYLFQAINYGTTQRYFCASQENLLSLMSSNPQLNAYQKTIDEFITYYGNIPPEVYSLCVNLQDLKTSNGQFESGCPTLSATLMCFDGSCLYKGLISFGCFNFF